MEAPPSLFSRMPGSPPNPSREKLDDWENGLEKLLGFANPIRNLGKDMTSQLINPIHLLIWLPETQVELPPCVTW